jgi:3-dehydroquinate dehydratase / shikimate dehydrogenase
VALAREAKAKALKHEQFAKSRFDVLINSTPCGMAGIKQALPIAENELNAGLVFDMVYNPLETPLLKLAKERGIPVISGLEMFVQQGARQFEIWTGKPAPEAEMLRVVELELRAGAAAFAGEAFEGGLAVPCAGFDGVLTDAGLGAGVAGATLGTDARARSWTLAFPERR